MPSFGDMLNESGDVPIKVRKDNDPMPVDVEGGEVGDYVGGEVVTATRTAESGSRSYTAFTVYVFPGDATHNGPVVQLLGYDSARARAIITNGGTDPIYLGPVDQINQGTGFTLPGGQTFTAEVQGPISVCVPAGITLANPIAVGVWAESDN